ncbi:MAG TPA: VOC family protein [Acidimicrobiales bacterium]|jgi:catechol 2,3-dioxygenase-like lactoylglutathione lyase family enzyme
MSRVQLALNVSDLDAAVDFYTKIFGTEPAKLRPFYANFPVAEPSPAARYAARPDLATQAPTPS